MDLAGNSIIALLTSCALFAWIGCNNLPPGEEGLLLTIHKDQPGPSIQQGQLIELTALERTEEGTVIWNSADDGRTALITQQSSVFKGDLFAAFSKLSKGDSATIKLPLDSMVTYLGHPKVPNTKSKYVVYEVAIVNVIDSQEHNQFMQQRMQQLKNKEAGSIARYIADKNLKTTTTISGLQYTVNKQGTGNKANPGDTVIVHYAATMLSGKMVDSALPTGSKQGSRTFIAGLGTTITGLEQALLLFPKGTQATLVIPSSLAFGEAGYEGIQPCTPLVYQWKVTDIRPLRGKRPTEPGAIMPDFALTNIANDIVVQKEDLAKGKTLFVLFNTDCEHCQQEVKAIETQYTSFRNIHLYFIAQQSKQDIRQFMQTWGPTLSGKPNVMVLQDTDRRFASIFQAATYPSIYVYSPQRILRRYFPGQTAMADLIVTLQ